jgi:hypothetical protein
VFDPLYLWPKFLAFIRPILGNTVLVFLRKNIGARALPLHHVLLGAVTLSLVSFGVEPGDLEEVIARRAQAEQTIRQCAASATGYLNGTYPCAAHVPQLKAMLLSEPIDLFPYTRVYLLAFLAVCIGHMVFARMRVAWGFGAVDSRSPGVPLLSFFTFWRFPHFAMVVLEPALVASVAWYFETRAHRHNVSLFFAFVALSLVLAGFDAWGRALVHAMDWQDFALRAGAGGGSMLRPPTRPARGGFFAAYNRARMLGDDEAPKVAALPPARSAAAALPAPASVEDAAQSASAQVIAFDDAPKRTRW